MGFLLVPLLVSAVFFLAVCFRDCRGDFRERTHYFEHLDPWEPPPPETPLDGRVKVAATGRDRDHGLQRKLFWWLALPACVSAVLWLVLAWPFLRTFLFVGGFIWSLALFRRIGIGLIPLTTVTMIVAIGMLSGWHVIRTHRSWSEPRLTLMVIPFEALGDDASQRSMANILNKGLKRELASWDGLDFIPVKTAFMAQRQTVDADQRGARLRPRYALEGSVLRTNETVSIRARLFDAQTARDVWSAQLNADPAEHSRILGELTSGIARALDNELAR